MVLQYVCIGKCFFDDKLIEKGQKLFLEDKVGDAFPHFMRVESNPVPKEMQEEAAPAEPKRAPSKKVKEKADDET